MLATEEPIEELKEESEEEKDEKIPRFQRQKYPSKQS